MSVEEGLPLFDYPRTAGHQGGDTDMAAAARIEKSGRAELLRNRVIDKLRECPDGMTADECADALGEDCSVRQRFTELKQRGILVDTGIRRNTAHGRGQRVLKLASGKECERTSLRKSATTHL